MPQLHLYVPREVAREVKRRAEANDKTVSAYLAEIVKREVADAWPEGFFDDVFGGWKGGALARPAQPRLEAREPLTGLVDAASGARVSEGPAIDAGPPSEPDAPADPGSATDSGPGTDRGSASGHGSPADRGSAPSH